MRKFILTLLLSVFLVTDIYALDNTIHEKSSHQWGHKSSPTSGVGTILKTAGGTMFQIFRCTYDGGGVAHHEVRLYIGGATGTFDMRLGLQELGSNGLPSGTWMGATNSGYEDIQPVFGWNQADLDETVDLVEGEYYAIVFDDFADVLDATHYIQAQFYQDGGVVTGRPQYLYGRNTRYEPADVGGYTAGASTVFYGRCAWDVVTDQHEGQPYTTMSSGAIYGPGHLGANEAWIQETFQAEDNMLVEGVGVLALRFSSANFPPDDLQYNLFDASGNTLRSGIQCKSQESVMFYSRWVESKFDRPVYLHKGKMYKLRFTAPLGNMFSDCWAVPFNQAINSHPYNIMTFQGTTGYMTFKNPFSGVVTDVSYADMPFYLMLKDSDQDMNYSRRKR